LETLHHARITEMRKTLNRMCTAGPGTAGDASQATKFELKSQRAECLNILRYTYGKRGGIRRCPRLTGFSSYVCSF